MATKVTSEKIVGNKRRVTVELNEGEEVVVVNPRACYKMGGQLDDIVFGNALTEATKVGWNHFTQEWEVSQ